ncbi:MAG: redoxin domain-containing protein [Planctomycetota bacterium]|nr:MAG: redoxin domain-containing protein [Planctomycetota bacterium]
MRLKKSLSAITVIAIVISCAFGGDEAYTPSTVYKEKLEKKLPLAGENRGEIEKFLNGVGDKYRLAAEFLIAHMSEGDLAAIDAATLNENFEYAIKARSEFAYSKELKDSLFLQYVLPHRVTQEPITRWRKFLYEKVKPRVINCKTLTEAALEVNRWCAENVTYKSTSRRDQSVFATLNRGIGRCEEEMVFYICAARSVGIPVRTCSTPLWPFTDSNHAWVEVWDGSAWRHLGACEPEEKLDRAWFTKKSKRTLMVVSSAYGDMETDEPVYRRKSDYTLVNSTPAYTDCMRKVSVRVRRDGKPAAGQHVNFEIFNFGGIRPFARRVTDSNGETFLDVAAGDFFVTAGDDKGRDYALARSKSDELIELDISKHRAPEGRFTLNVAPLPAPEIEKPRQIGSEERLRGEIAGLRSERTRLRREKKLLENRAAHPELSEFLKQFEEDLKPITDKFIEAGANWKELSEALTAAPAEQRDDLIWLISKMTVKDVIEIKSLTLLEHLLLADETRKEIPWKLDTDTYRQYVFQFRIRYEHAGAWRRVLRERFAGLRGDTIRKTAENVNRWTADNLRKRAASRLETVPLPTDTVRGGSGSEYALAACAVGILRSIGVPAKMPEKRGHNWAEFFEDGKWLPLYPLEPESIGDTSKSEAARKKYAKRGILKIEFTRYNEPFKKAKFYRDWAVAKYDNGSWTTFYEGVDIKKEGHVRIMEFEPGEYLFSAGSRFGDGAPNFNLQHVEIRSGKTTEVRAEISIPFEDYSGRGIKSPFPKGKRVPDFTCNLLGGGEYKLSERLAEKRQLFITLHPHAGWSRKMIKSLNGSKDRLARFGIEVAGICPVSNVDSAKKCVAELGIKFQVIHDPDGRKTNPWIGAKEKPVYKTALPVVTLVRRNRTIVFQTIRNEPGIVDLVLSAAMTLPKIERKSE